MEYTTEQIQEAYLTLPEEVRDYIVSAKTADGFQRIVTKHNLIDTKIKMLGKESNLVMLGLLEWENFYDEVMNKLEMTASQTDNILMELDSEIFAPLRKIMDSLETNEDATKKTSLEIGSGKIQQEITDDPALMPTVVKGQTIHQNPAPAPFTSSAPFLANKLSSAVRMPIENITVKVPERPAPADQFGTFQNPAPDTSLEKQPAAPKPVYKGPDPYREQPK